MNIYLPPETFRPDDDGTFHRTRSMMPVPNKTIVIQEEWQVQDDGTILILESWHVEVSDE